MLLCLCSSYAWKVGSTEGRVQLQLAMHWCARRTARRHDMSGEEQTSSNVYMSRPAVFTLLRLVMRLGGRHSCWLRPRRGDRDNSPRTPRWNQPCRPCSVYIQTPGSGRSNLEEAQGRPKKRDSWHAYSEIAATHPGWTAISTHTEEYTEPTTPCLKHTFSDFAIRCRWAGPAGSFAPWSAEAEF